MPLRFPDFGALAYRFRPRLPRAIKSGEQRHRRQLLCAKRKKRQSGRSETKLRPVCHAEKHTGRLLCISEFLPYSLLDPSLKPSHKLMFYSILFFLY